MKKVILVVVILAVVGILAYKFTGNSDQTPNTNVAVTTSSSVANTQTTTAEQKVFYLFHDPGDQDAGCRAIYATADTAEKELSGQVKVVRPDVKTEKALVEKYKIKVLPTIIITSADGTEQQRFESEGTQVSSSINNAIAKLKELK